MFQWRTALVDIGQRLLAGGTRLRPYERTVIEEAKGHLSEKAYARLIDQLACVAFCQREHDDRMVGIFYSSAMPYPNADGEEEILRGKLMRPEGREAVSFGVFTHRGRLASIEFRKSPRAFQQGPFRIDYTPKPWRKQKPMPEVFDDEERAGENLLR